MLLKDKLTESDNKRGLSHGWATDIRSLDEQFLGKFMIVENLKTELWKWSYNSVSLLKLLT